jgi:hypothetical protein
MHVCINRLYHRVRKTPNFEAESVGSITKDVDLKIVKVENGWGKLCPSMYAGERGDDDSDNNDGDDYGSYDDSNVDVDDDDDDGGAGAGDGDRG